MIFLNLFDALSFGNQRLLKRYYIKSKEVTLSVIKYEDKTSTLSDDNIFNNKIKCSRNDWNIRTSP